MAAELAAAFREGGCEVIAEGDDVARCLALGPVVLVYLNFRPLEAIPAEARRPGSRLAVLQYFVDHPLNLDAPYMDRAVQMPTFRTALPCVDGLHWLRQRWPTLRHGHVLHGVPRAALCDAAAVAPSHARGQARSRPHDVVVAGSIDTADEVARRRETIPESLRPAADEMVELLLARPDLGFEQALDACLGPRGVMTGLWATAAGLFRYVTCAVNRRRRTALVGALRGLDVLVHGPECWREFCTGTIRYGGEVPYDGVSAAFARGRVLLAWGPTQFTHSFSERLLLGMGAGCACASDDRLLVRRHFAPSVSPHAPAGAGRLPPPDPARDAVALFDAGEPAHARAVVEHLLRDDNLRTALAQRGRAEVEARHLWVHRVPALINLAADAVAMLAR
jgi:hypothetical protein